MPYRPPGTGRKRVVKVRGFRAIVHRETGLPMGPYTPVFEQDWPYQEVHPSQVVWRYQSLDKFFDMMQSAALYFRRADKFPGDPLEGTLSPEGIYGTSASDRAFAGAYKISPEEHKNMVAGHEPMRRAVFVNCWNMNQDEDARMWREYTDTPDSVVVRSTALALKQNLPDRVLMAGVTYIEKDAPRTIFDHGSLFFYKDAAKFKHEAELRLVVFKEPDETILWDDPKDFGRKIPVNLRCIDTVVLHPAMSDNRKAEVRRLVQTLCPGTVVEDSRIKKW